MPHLYGQPFKDELRREIRSLNASLSKALSERRLVQNRLIIRNAEIRELKAKNQELVRLAQELLRVAEQPIDINVGEELEKESKRRRSELMRSTEQAA